MTPAQRRLYNQACTDLSRGMTWDGMRLDKDEWRLLLTSVILGQRAIRNPLGGLVIMGRSSKELSVEQAGEAITLAFSMGDEPWSYDPTQKNRIRWSAVIRANRGITEDEK